MDCYYKLQHLFYYKVRHGLLQIATGITKRDDYYKLRQYTNESSNKDFLKSQTGASYTIRTKQRIKSCKVTASFCKRNATQQQQKPKTKRKEIEDAKLLLCR